VKRGDVDCAWVSWGLGLDRNHLHDVDGVGSWVSSSGNVSRRSLLMGVGGVSADCLVDSVFMVGIRVTLENVWTKLEGGCW
jgi:hypothetical protein